MNIIDFIKSFPVQCFERNEVLLSPEQQTDKILVIRDGTVKVSSFNNTGDERLLWIAGRYDIIPSEKFFSPASLPRYFYTAFCNGSAYVVDKKQLLQMAQADIGAMSQIARSLSEHYDDLLNRINSIEQSDLRGKILYMLQTLCEKFSGADVVQLHELGLNLTHQDVADMVRATREAVSIELKRLQTAGYISYSRTGFTVYYNKICQQNKTSA